MAFDLPEHVLGEVAIPSNDQTASLTLPRLTGAATAVVLPQAYLTLPMLDAIGEMITFGQGGPNRLPLLNVDGLILGGSDITADLALPLLVTEGSVGPDADLILPLLQVDGTVVSTNVLQAALVLPSFTAQADVLSTNQLSADLVLPLPVVDSQLAAGSLVSADLTLPSLQMAGVFLSGAAITADLTLPLYTMAGLVASGSLLSGAVTLPMLQLVAQIQEAEATAFQAWVINTRTKALSRYVGFNFNSLANFNGRVLAAGAGGVVLLEGGDDAGVQIPASITTGVSSLGSSQQKKIPRAYADYFAANGLTVTPNSVEQGVHTYVLAPVPLGRVQQRRVTFGKGLQSAHWQLTLRNIRGGDFRLESLTLYPETTDRKVNQRG